MDMYGAFSALDTTLRVANERSLAGAADRQKGEQNDAVLMGVWEIIQSGFADIEQQRQERKPHGPKASENRRHLIKF